MSTFSLWPVCFLIFFSTIISQNCLSAGFELVSNASTDSIKVGKYVIAAGGGQSSTSGIIVKGTVGQIGIGRSITNSYQVFSGFWMGSSQSCCLGVTGDLNSDGQDNTVLDLTFLIDQIFRGGPDPFCSLEGDLNGDGTPSQVMDLTILIDKIFRGGPSPAQCH